MTSENPTDDKPVPPPVETSQNSDDKNACPPNSVPPRPTPEVHTEPTHPCHEVTCKTKRAGWDYAKLVAELVGLGFLIVYTIYTAGIYCENKKAAQAALDTLGEIQKQYPEIVKSADATKRAADSEVAANRAWIVPDFPPQHKRVIEEANLEWHNAGKTPAIGVFSWKEYFSGEFPKRMNTCTESESIAKKDPMELRQYQAFVAEGGRYEIGLDHAPAWIGQQPIFIHGCIWYTDISSNTVKSSEFFYMAAQNKYALPSSEGISLFFDRAFTYK